MLNVNRQGMKAGAKFPLNNADKSKWETNLGSLAKYQTTNEHIT